ncbi:hypothetical protein M0R45_009744 [Rubus argutus]|uniref:Disease resistance R13L4/SHOC-2-like LRR domain-containing protein n=1 Tax=Rubus argutus TaxID=59490 RepID=A0AAW1Y512_RUBAR
MQANSRALTNRSGISKLPDDIVNCFNLKYLNLRSTKVKELPEDIGKLSNLEMLNISNSKIRLLPVGILNYRGYAIS